MPLDIKDLSQHLRRYRAELAKGAVGGMDARIIKQQITALKLDRKSIGHIHDAIREARNDEEQELIISLLKNNLNPSEVSEIECRRIITGLYLFCDEIEKRNFIVKLYKALPPLLKSSIIDKAVSSNTYSALFSVAGMWDAVSVDNLYLEYEDKPDFIQFLIDSKRLSAQAILRNAIKAELAESEISSDKLSEYQVKGIDTKTLFKLALEFDRVETMKVLLAREPQLADQAALETKIIDLISQDEQRKGPLAIKALELMIDAGVKLDVFLTADDSIPFIKGCTPLMVAARHSEELLDVLLKHPNKLGINSKSSKNLTALSMVMNDIALMVMHGITLGMELNPQIEKLVKNVKKLLQVKDIDVTIADNAPFKTALKIDNIELACLIYNKSEPKPMDGVEFLNANINKIITLANADTILRTFIPKTLSLTEVMSQVVNYPKVLFKLVDLATTEADFDAYANLLKESKEKEISLLLFDAKVPTQIIKEILKRLPVEQQNSVINDVVSKLSSEKKYDELENTVFKRLKNLNLNEEQLEEIYVDALANPPAPVSTIDPVLTALFSYRDPDDPSNKEPERVAAKELTTLFDKYHTPSESAKNTVEAIRALRQIGSAASSTDTVPFDLKTFIDKGINVTAFIDIVIKKDQNRNLTDRQVKTTFNDLLNLYGDKLSANDKQQILLYSLYTSNDELLAICLQQQFMLDQAFTNGKYKGKTPLQVSLERGTTKPILMLLGTKKSLNINHHFSMEEPWDGNRDTLSIHNYSTQSALGYCIKMGLYAVAEELLNLDEFDVNFPNNQPFHDAIQKGKLTLALKIYQHKSNKMVLSNEQAQSMISLAISNQDPETLRFIYALGNWPLSDSDLSSLADWGNSEAIQLCISKGGLDPQRICIAVAKAGMWDTLDKLIGENNVLNITLTPALRHKLMLVAIDQGNFDIVQKFITEGAEVKNNNSEALISAATAKVPNLKIFEMLLDCGANPAANNYGLPIDAFDKYCETQDPRYLDIAKLILLNFYKDNAEVKNNIQTYFANIDLSVIDIDSIQLQIILFIRESLSPVQCFAFDYLQMQIIKAKIRANQTETAMDQALTKRATLHFNNVVKPAVKKEFDKVKGVTEMDKVATIERDIKGLILDEIVADCKMAKADDQASQKMLAFVNAHREALLEGKDQVILKQMIALTSNNDIAHLAWRAYDLNVTRDAVWEPLLSANFVKKDDESRTASKDIRTRVAMYYLGKPNTISFIGQLASMERVPEHSFTNDTTDSFSCYPGCVGRVARMGEASNNFLQLPPSRPEKMLDFVEKIIYKHYADKLSKLKADKQEVLLYALTALTPNTAVDILNDKSGHRFPMEWLKAREEFMRELESVEEITRSMNELYAQERQERLKKAETEAKARGEKTLNPDIKRDIELETQELDALEIFYLRSEMFDIGGSGRSASLIVAYEKMLPKQEVTPIAKKPDTVPNPFRFSFADKNLPATHTGNKIRKYIEFEQLYPPMAQFFSSKNVSEETLVEWLRTLINEVSPKTNDKQELGSFMQSEALFRSLTTPEQGELLDLIAKSSFSNGLSTGQAKAISVKLSQETKDEAMAKKLNTALEKVCPLIEVVATHVAEGKTEVPVDDSNRATSSTSTTSSRRPS